MENGIKNQVCVHFNLLFFKHAEVLKVNVNH